MCRIYHIYWRRWYRQLRKMAMLEVWKKFAVIPSFSEAFLIHALPSEEYLPY
jgi:hypothetical protein